jgi:hypothetical protein
LEESLNLDELFLLYRACTNDLSTQIKITASASGADVDWSEDWYDEMIYGAKPPEVIQQSDLRLIPIGLGYEG